MGVRRGERWIIRHVDITVDRGQLIYLIGANGAGKSTCAKAILGLLDIDEGTIERMSSLEVGYPDGALSQGPHRICARRRRPGPPR